MVPLLKAGICLNWTDTVPEAMRRLDSIAQVLCRKDAPAIASSLHWEIQVVKRHPPATARQLDDLAELTRLLADCRLVSQSAADELQVARKPLRKGRVMNDEERGIAENLVASFEVLEKWRVGRRIDSREMRALRYVCALRLAFKSWDWSDKRRRLLRTFYEDLTDELEKYGEMFLQYRKQNYPSPAVYDESENSAKVWMDRMSFECHLINEVGQAYEFDLESAVILESVRVILKQFVRAENIPKPLLLDYYTLRRKLESMELLVGRTQQD